MRVLVEFLDRDEEDAEPYWTSPTYMVFEGYYIDFHYEGLSYYLLKQGHGYRALAPKPTIYYLYEDGTFCEERHSPHQKSQWRIQFPKQVSKAIRTWRIIAQNHLPIRLQKELIEMIVEYVKASLYHHTVWFKCGLPKHKKKKLKRDFE